MTHTSALLGVAFALVGFAAMFLMYRLWGYPYDKEKRLSSAPRWAMWMHRGLGYAFVAIYVVLMWRMVPRLWEYQVEFPARTVVHMVLGFSIGFLLLIKVAIMRFFRHFEEWMPYLGTAIMLSTVILLGLSLPLFFQEQALAKAALGKSAFSAASRQRVAELLPTAEMPSGTDLVALSTGAALQSGRDVLLGKCVKCHDLKTILAKPRTPSGWWQVVERMADKPALFAPMSDRDLLEVTAYLIAINTDLQRSVKARREQELAKAEGMQEIESEMAQSAPPTADTQPSPGTVADPATPSPPPSSAKPPAPAPGAPPTPPATKPPPPPVDLAKAKTTYQHVCSQCHELSDVDASPPRSRRDAERMVRRMISENDAEISASEVRLIVAYLEATFAKK